MPPGGRRGDRFGLEIRKACGSDAPGLAALLGAPGDPAALAALAGRIEALQSGQGSVLVAVEWGPPSGVVALGWTWTLADGRPLARIDTLVVGPEQRRRGIGRLLLKAASQAARAAGCETVHLAVPAGDAVARGFAEATGFVEASAGYARSLRKRSLP